LPEAGMAMIRYHSFYPWHSGGSYKQLLKKEDGRYMDWIRDFNQYDLYTKSNKTYTLDEVRQHYEPIAHKYLGEGPIFW
jgi:inositol oxygenase